jgi:phage protein U
MYAQLGNIRFEGLRGFTSLGREREATFAELPLLDGKARLQRLGSALDAIKFDMLLRREFTDPVADLAEMNDLRENGEVLPLLTGDGAFIGNFVITRLTDSTDETDTTGVPVSITISVELKEFVDPNPEATADADAKKAAFATSPQKVVPVTVERAGTTPAAVTSGSVRESSGACNSAVSDVKKAAVNTDQEQSLLQRAGESLKNAQDKAQTAIQNLQDYASLQAVAPALLATVQQVAANAGTLKALIASGDLTNALTQADTLSASVGNMDSSVRPLDALLMKRGPQ